MTPIDQMTVDQGRGDCMRAVVASLFDLELDQVPHFRLYDIKENRGNSDRSWFNIFTNFISCLGYDFEYYLRSYKKKELEAKHSIDGYFYAAVHSKTFENTKHAVIINLDGIVVHDPSPNKKWQGLDAMKSGELDGWYCFKKKLNSEGQ